MCSSPAGIKVAEPGNSVCLYSGTRCSRSIGSSLGAGTKARDTATRSIAVTSRHPRTSTSSAKS
jgi:hypothetical protein